MATRVDLPELDVPFSFSRQATSIPADLRPLWLIPLVLLILHHCGHGAKASFQKLHVLSWAARTPERQRSFIEYLEGRQSPEAVLVRYEPGLDRALRFAVAEKLIAALDGNRFQLIVKGSAVVRQIIDTPACFQSESDFLRTVGRRLTEKLLTQLVRLEQTSWA